MPGFTRGSLRTNKRGVVAVEFALLAIPFVSLILFVFELSYDLFQQAALDSGLHLAVRQIQTGNAQSVLSGNDFNTRFLCPSIGGLLACSNLYVKVQKISPTAAQDYYAFTTGTLPLTNGSLDLTSFASGNFCNTGPAQFMLISAIYVGPSFIGRFFTNALAVNYAGTMVHATLSTVGVVSENWPATAAAAGSAPSC